MASQQDKMVVIGKLTTVYGVKGWLKVYSFTDPMEGFLDYDHCFIQRDGQWQAVEFDQGRRHGKGLVIHIAGVDDRDLARSYSGCEVAVSAEALPELKEDEYYWYQLQGLQVFTSSASGEERLLGRVDHLMATGANDVLVVRACAGSIDQRERLIPYVPNQFVLEIKLEEGRINVDWDPDF